MSVEETKNCLVMSAAPCCCSISVEKKDKSDVCGLVVIYLTRNYIISFKLYDHFLCGLGSERVSFWPKSFGV